jgi:DNA-binding NarL/FixJ family response regulator
MELMRREEAAAAAVRRHRGAVAGPRGVRPSTASNPHQLTKREMEVLRLLCAGLRNSEIAGRLFRSVRTVDHHLESVFAKLGVGSRTAAVMLALTTGLLQACGNQRCAD